MSFISFPSATTSNAPSYTTYKMETMDLGISIPFFFILIAVEAVYAIFFHKPKPEHNKRQGKFAKSLGLYRTNDTVASLACVSKSWVQLAREGGASSHTSVVNSH